MTPPPTPPPPTPPPTPPTTPARRQPQDMPVGLARERTQLAWSRTVIAFAAVGGALLRTNVAGGLTVVGMGVLVWGLCRILPRAAAPDSQAVRLLIVTAGVTLVSLVALGVVILAR